jgi:DNA repair exonuclease SbcCD ATPase subunit
LTLSLKHIQLHNFRGIRDLDWQFHTTPGFYFVQGQNLKEPSLGANGAGKSTIFVDAPYWILTGKTIMSQRPGNSVARWELDRDGDTHVYGELALTIGDNEYVIRRGRSPTVLTINNRTVEQNEIDKLIPLSDSALRRTLLLGQRSLMFLDLRPEEKSRLFSETLDLDIWLHAAELAGDSLKEKEREAAKIEARFASLTGSINEIRDQHEAAVLKEEDFAKQHATRLAELKRIGSEELARIDALKLALREAQERHKASALSSTSDDELRNHRAAEREFHAALIRLDNEEKTRLREATQLEHQLESYNDAICPECKQPLLDQEHTHKRRQELLATAQEVTELLEGIPKRRMILNNSITNIEQATLRLEEANKAYREATSEISGLETQITAQERVVVRVTNDIRKVESETNPFSQLCDQLEVRYNALIEQREVLGKQDDSLNQEIEILKFWQKGYRDIRLEQIDATLLELELATNRNAAALGLQDWEIQFATERENKSGSVSHAFSIFLFPPGQKSPVSWDSYSGGEAQRWQLAVTFALSEVLLSRAGITADWEVLDEPTGFLSREGIDDLLECLHTRAHELQRRVYLIDHRSLERGSFDGIINVIKDGAGIHIEA